MAGKAQAEGETQTTPAGEEKEGEKVEVPGRKIDLLIVHCTDTPNGKDYDAADVDEMHHGRWNRKKPWVEEFNPDYKHIGYHFVIRVDGSIQTGRHVNEVGAHVKGQNVNSLGITMVGRSAFTAAQWTALDEKLKELEGEYPEATIHGHNEYAAKDCPGFDVQEWLDGGRKALADNLV